MNNSPHARARAMSFRGLENLPDPPIVIPMSLLKLAGVLDRDSFIGFECSAGRNIGIQSRVEERRISIILSPSDFPMSFVLSYSSKKLKYGSRPYFVDEHGDYLECVILYYRRLYSKDQFYRTVGVGSERFRRQLIDLTTDEARFRMAETMPPTQLRKIMREARDDPELESWLPPRLRALLEEERISEPGSDRSDASDFPADFLLENALPAELSDWFSDYAAETPKAHVRGWDERLERPRPSFGQARRFPALTTEELRLSGLLERGSLHGYLLTEPKSAFGEHGLRMVVDMRDRNRPMVMFGKLDEADQVDEWERVTLASYERRHWHFRCPLTGDLKRSLYFREGIAGSRMALALR